MNGFVGVFECDSFFGDDFATQCSNPVSDFVPCILHSTGRIDETLCGSVVLSDRRFEQLKQRLHLSIVIDDGSVNTDFGPI